MTPEKVLELITEEFRRGNTDPDILDVIDEKPIRFICPKSNGDNPLIKLNEDEIKFGAEVAKS